MRTMDDICVYLIMFLLIWNRVISIGNVLFVFCYSLDQKDFFLLWQQIVHSWISSSDPEEAGVRAINSSQNMFVRQLIIWCLWHRKPFVLFYSRRRKKQPKIFVAGKIASWKWIHHWSMSYNFLKFTAPKTERWKKTEEMKSARTVNVLTCDDRLPKIYLTFSCSTDKMWKWKMGEITNKIGKKMHCNGSYLFMFATPKSSMTMTNEQIVSSVPFATFILFAHFCCCC